MKIYDWHKCHQSMASNICTNIITFEWISGKQVQYPKILGGVWAQQIHEREEANFLQCSHPMHEASLDEKWSSIKGDLNHECRGMRDQQNQLLKIIIKNHHCRSNPSARQTNEPCHGTAMSCVGKQIVKSGKYRYEMRKEVIAGYKQATGSHVGCQWLITSRYQLGHIIRFHSSSCNFY